VDVSRRTYIPKGEPYIIIPSCHRFRACIKKGDSRYAARQDVAQDQETDLPYPRLPVGER
jgi:hypothetical protein